MNSPELQQGTVVDGRYLLKEYKGSGSFGEVWKAEDTELGIEVAIKLYISLDQNGQSEFKDEYKIAFGLSHENLLTAQYYGVWQHRPYLIMKYCENGNASALAGKTDEKTIWRFIHDVASGLRYLHGLEPPIVHQDIKPENILRDERGRFLITDFGISRKMRNTMRKQSQRVQSSGAIPYMGPERFTADPVTVNASDIWSLGVSAFELAVGDLPFMGQGGAMLNCGAEIPDIDFTKYSKDLNNLIRSCLTKNTWDRPTAAQLEEYTAKRLAGDKSPWIPPEMSEEDQATIRDFGGIARATVPAGESPKEKAFIKKHKSKKLLWTTIAATFIVLAVGIFAAWYFVLRDNGDTSEAADASMSARFTKLKNESIKNIDAATNDNYEPLLTAAQKIDTLDMMIVDDKYLRDSLATLKELVGRYNAKAENAIDAWMKAANTQYEVAEDLPAAIEYYNIASSLYLPRLDSSADFDETTNLANQAIERLAQATQCPGVYMGVTKCSLSDDGKSVEVEYNGLTPRVVNGVDIHYILYDRTTGDISNALVEGDATISIEAGKGRKLIIDVPQGTDASAISLSANGTVFYNTKP